MKKYTVYFENGAALYGVEAKGTEHAAEEARKQIKSCTGGKEICDIVAIRKASNSSCAVCGRQNIEGRFRVSFNAPGGEHTVCLGCARSVVHVFNKHPMDYNKEKGEWDCPAKL